MKAVLDEGYDAVFVGSGAPRGKELDLPGRHDETGDTHIHIGIDWLQSIAFDHISSIGERILIIGVGNTAMDCCRSSRRLGGKNIKVMARRPPILQSFAVGTRRCGGRGCSHRCEPRAKALCD